MLKVLCRTLLAVVICGPQARADQITLKNGDRLTGQILKADGQSLTLQSEFASTVTVQWEAITQISSEQPLHLALKDSRMIVGTMATAAGKIAVRTSEAGTVTLAKDEIQALRSEQEQAAYQAEQDRLRDPGLLDFWSGTADAGLSLDALGAGHQSGRLQVSRRRRQPGQQLFAPHQCRDGQPRGVARGASPAP